ncbi:unnamed protein product [Lymnaea stagnalis]|uniref:Uncharacterized protein n=1 Tax=Lymnaea stagnalis TaxID=6523 RepID=A0AAV2IDE7_LYMST
MAERSPESQLDNTETIETDKVTVPNAQKKETLEDLLSTLSQQINSTNWLQQNTPEKFAEENPEIAGVFKSIRESSKADEKANDQG